MKLNTNKILWASAILLIIVNFLVLFNIDYYIRTILALIFVLYVPGILTMLILKIENNNFWEKIVYSIGISLSLLMILGLIINWLFPLLGINQPLKINNFIVAYDLAILIILILFKYRRKNEDFQINFPILNITERILLLASIALPFLSIIGAFRLNNQHSNTITLIMLGLIGACFLFTIILRKKINPKIIPFILLMMTMSLLFMYSMRSWHISGYDIYTEYNMFETTKENYRWSSEFFPGNAYNSCLSITILPTIISQLTFFNDEYVFKFIFQIIFSIMPIIVYLIILRYSNAIVAFIGSFFIISQIWFIEQMPSLIRQEIAFIFLTLLLLALFDKEISKPIKNTLVLLFGLSMIISHYTTTYVALALLIMAYILEIVIIKTNMDLKIMKFFSKIFLNKKMVLKNKNKKSSISGIILILLFIFTTVWTIQITHSQGNALMLIKEITKTTSSGIPGISLNEIYHKIINKNALPKSYFNSEQITREIYNQYQNYSVNLYEKNLTKEQIPNLVRSEPIMPIIKSDNLEKYSSWLSRNLLFLINYIFIIPGIIFLVYIKYFMKKDIDSEYITMAILSFLLIGLSIAIPFFSERYSISRMYIQSLIFLAFPAVIGCIYIFSFTKKFKYIVTGIIFLLYFIVYSGLLFQIVGGTNPFMHLNNFGGEYNKHYSHLTDIKSAQWLDKNRDHNRWVYVDNIANLRLIAFSDIRNIKTEVYTFTIDRNSYVYLDYANKIDSVAFQKYSGDSVSYEYPVNFLNEKKNIVYNNEGSQIYK